MTKSTAQISFSFLFLPVLPKLPPISFFFFFLARGPFFLSFRHFLSSSLLRFLHSSLLQSSSAISSSFNPFLLLAARTAAWAFDLIDAAANGWAQGGFVRRQRRHELAAAACTEEARAGKINRRRVQAFGIDAMIGWWRRIDVAGLLFPSALFFIFIFFYFFSFCSLIEHGGCEVVE